ncbi:MAG: hypothetical protein GY805_31690 [Chloroflexi bacterium]|nr:hypothetical protein [Chloroflexota bacterium]
MNKPNPDITKEDVVTLMHRLEKTLEDSYSCEESFALLDEYVELVATDEEAKRLMPLIKNHLDMCPDCREEFETLLYILKTADSES